MLATPSFHDALLHRACLENRDGPACHGQLKQPVGAAEAKRAKGQPAVGPSHKSGPLRQACRLTTAGKVHSRVQTCRSTIELYILDAQTCV